MPGTGPSMTEEGFLDFANKLNPAPLRRSRVFLAPIPAQASVVSTRLEAPASAKRLKTPLVVSRSRSTSCGP